jgi:hypothetical protein
VEEKQQISEEMTAGKKRLEKEKQKYESEMLSLRAEKERMEADKNRYVIQKSAAIVILIFSLVRHLMQRYIFHHYLYCTDIEILQGSFNPLYKDFTILHLAEYPSTLS